MVLDIISIGDELLIGQTLNTNAHWLSKQFNAIGFVIRQHTSIADDRETILNAVESGLKNADVLVITGGLGPTNDDLTMPVLNEYFGGELVEDKEVLNDVELYILSRGGVMNENNKKQALVSSKCTPIRNTVGTAPGLWFEKDGKVVVAMPGVPHETKNIVTNVVLPKLKEKFQLPIIKHQMVQTVGVPEALLAEKLVDWEKQLPTEIKLAYLPSPGRVKLRLTCIGNDEQYLNDIIAKEADNLNMLIGKHIYAVGDFKLEENLGELLTKTKETIATAESCTGGYLAHLITSVSGSSSYFKGSIVAYDNEVKINELDVEEQIISEYGAVSEEVVKQMAIGVRNKLNTTYAIATSGIAGPTGGTKEKPVGTVWIAIAYKNGVVANQFNFGTERAINIERAAIKGMELLLEQLA